MLDSFYVRNFRLFEELSIERLGRLNLIVGLNNSGKSCLLEALYLYGTQADIPALYHMVEMRGEDWELQSMGPGEIIREEAHPFRSFFPGYRFPETQEPDLLVGPRQDADCIGLRVSREQDSRHQNDLIITKSKGTSTLGTLYLEQEIERYARFGGSRHLKPADETKAIQFVPTKHQPVSAFFDLWDHINLNPETREKVFDALRLVDPNFREVVMINQIRLPTPIMLYKNNETKVPLASLGDGINHLFRIILSLFNAAGGMLLIDEFENGLHYSVQPKVWDLIFKMAHELDIQVFVTTHSWDCIEAFREASKDNDKDAMLFHLGRSHRTSDKGQIVVIDYDHDDLMLSTKSDLDVR